MQIYPATVKCIRSSEEDVSEVDVSAFYAKNMDISVEKRSIADFLKDKENLEKRGVLANTIDRINKAFEWLNAEVLASDLCGITMTDIVRKYESENNQRSLTPEPEKQSFGLDDLGHAIEYGLGNRIIFRVGVSVARFVSQKVRLTFDFSRIKCSFSLFSIGTINCQSCRLDQRSARFARQATLDLKIQLIVNVLKSVHWRATTKCDHGKIWMDKFLHMFSACFSLQFLTQSIILLEYAKKERFS